MTRTKWYPWGRHAEPQVVRREATWKVKKGYKLREDEELRVAPIEIEANKRGCADGPCVHIRMNIATTPKDARHIANAILKASIIAEGIGVE